MPGELPVQARCWLGRRGAACGGWVGAGRRRGVGDRWGRGRCGAHILRQRPYIIETMHSYTIPM